MTYFEHVKTVTLLLLELKSNKLFIFRNDQVMSES